MNKLNSISEFSIILNRGYGKKSECLHFNTLDHPKLIEQFIEYVKLHAKLIGLTKIEDRQSIADNGCDVYIELRNSIKIGVQIKSPNDFKAADLAIKVKAQYSDTKILGLDKYYILLCCDMSTPNSRKVNYLTSYFAAHKTNYHAIFNPHNCIKIFNPGGLISDPEFAEKKQLYSFEDDQSKIISMLVEIQKEVKVDSSTVTTLGMAVKSALNRPLFNKLEHAKKFIKFLELDSKVDPLEVVDDINNFILKLGKLGPTLRNFYFLIIKESTNASHYVDGLEMSLVELGSLLNGNKREILGNIEVLSSKKYELVSYDEDEPNHVLIHIWLHGDYNLIKEIKTFAEENNIDIEDVFLKGDFSLLDE